MALKVKKWQQQGSHCRPVRNHRSKIRNKHTWKIATLSTIVNMQTSRRPSTRIASTTMQKNTQRQQTCLFIFAVWHSRGNTAHRKNTYDTTQVLMEHVFAGMQLLNYA